MIGSLWDEYLEVRRDLSRGGRSVATAGELEQQADHLEERLLINYSPLVKYVAGRISARITGVVDREDLASAGLLRLLEAIQKFDGEREVKFETYAISKIRWAVLDELRRDDSLPRRLRSEARERERAWGELAQLLRREPTEAELTKRVGRSTFEHRTLVHQEARTQVYYDLEILDETAENPESSTQLNELRKELASAMRILTEKERVVVTLYYDEGLTLREIGQTLQLTESRISQVLKQSLAKLRYFIGDEDLASSGLL
ncbi:MAG: FliA/WhiG family RNA polymerase sigma factor [Rubrobacteraceae bacterium]